MFSSVWYKSRLQLTRAAILTVLMFGLFASVNVEAQGVGYWHTSGSQILDANSRVVRIAGINWYGFETTDEIAHGIYAQDYHSILNTIHAEGYNTIRMPFSNQMVESPIVPTAISFSNAGGPINADLAGLNSLQILDKIIRAAGALGLKVILVNHRSEAGNSNEPNGLWYTANYPEAKWIADWKGLAARYKTFADTQGNPVVIGVDLRNEPHLLAQGARTGSCWTGDTWTNGCAVTNTAQNWPAAAARAGNAVLSVNPALLIAVEGTDCYSGDCGWQGGNLEGAGKYPVQLSVANRLVYSAHDYGPDLSGQAWFTSKTTSAILQAAWSRYWGYLSAQQIAPVWLGEFGTTNVSSDVTSNAAGSQGQWFSALVSFLGNQPSISWTYWALNGEDDFGLLDKGYGAVPPSSQKQQMLASIQFRLSGVGSPAPVCAAVPTAPKALVATAVSSASIQLGWKAVTPPANCSVTYSVYRSMTTGFTPATANRIGVGLTSPSYIDGSMTAATTYYYRLVAVDAKGSSAASAQVSAKTPAKASGVGCHVTYAVASQWGDGFQTSVSVQNTGTTSVSAWTLQWAFANGQKLTSFWNGVATQTGTVVAVKNEAYNGTIAPGATVTGMGFTASHSGTNAVPVSFTLNGVVCK